MHAAAIHADATDDDLLFFEEELVVVAVHSVAAKNCESPVRSHRGGREELPASNLD